jgi:hypothetical protein
VGSAVGFLRAPIAGNLELAFSSDSNFDLVSFFEL